jgi:hypothetical protein
MATKTKKATSPAADAGDLLAQLAGGVPVAAPKTAAKKGRPELQLPAHVEQQFKDYIPVKALADVIGSREEVLKSDLNAELMRLHIANFWKLRTLPTNPALKATNDDGTPDCEGMLVIQSRFMIEVPDLKPGQKPQDAIAALFTDMGLDSANATNLVNNELDFTPDIAVKINELLNGRKIESEWHPATDEEKALGKKISGWLMGTPTDPISPEERAMALRVSAKAAVKDGFLQRVCGYCRSEAELANVFKVIRPVIQNRGAKFGISDTPTRRTERLMEICKDTLGTAEEAKK